MTEIDDLLEMIEAPRTDLAADVTRGERSLRRRRRRQVSAAAVSVAAVAALGVVVQGSSGSPDAAGFAGTASASAGASPSAHDTGSAERQRVKRMERRLSRQAAFDPRETYRRVLKAHLDPAGDRIGPLTNEQGGTGVYGTKLDWNHGGMLEIVVSHSWGGAAGFYLLGQAHLKDTTYDGHPARVSTAGDDEVVSVQHEDGTVVTLIASAAFGNNGTTTSSVGLTQAELLDAAADPALKLPPWVAP
jgi:hypothetical protein